MTFILKEDPEKLEGNANNMVGLSRNLKDQLVVKDESVAAINGNRRKRSIDVTVTFRTDQDASSDEGSSSR